jgi:hypothetical protein
MIEQLLLAPKKPYTPEFEQTRRKCAGKRKSPDVAARAFATRVFD